MKICPQCVRAYDDSHQVCEDDKAALVPISSDESDPVLGKLLAGRYLITEKLGQGGMGSVYKAVHTQMDRICAIKLLSLVTRDMESAIARFKREAKMASRIDNPHAVTIYDFGQAEDGLLYLAMEYIPGKPLTRLLEKQWPLGLERVVKITTQIADALSAAHALGIVHRDLKPDNIMITQKGEGRDYVKVLDFGIAKAVTEESENLTGTGFILGTPVYMSPEQISGSKLDARSDTYSLAIIVYEMLSRRLPFEGDNAQAIMIKRLMNDPTPLKVAAPSMSEMVEQAVMAALARDREDRTPTAIAFAAALNAAAHASTQSIGDQSTNKISDDSDRSTTPVSDRDTVAAGSDMLGPGMGSETLPIESYQPTVGPDQMQSPAAPGGDLPPPASFVTNPSSSLKTPGRDAREQPQAQAGQAQTDLVSSTVDLISAPPDKPKTPKAPAVEDVKPRPTRKAVIEPGPTRRAVIEPEPAVQAVPALDKPVISSQRTSKSIIAIAAIVLIGIFGLGLGYFLVSRNASSPVSNSDQPAGAASPAPEPSNPAGSIDEKAAREHYDYAKKHQEQAYLLKNAGSKAEALAENEIAITSFRKAIQVMPKFPQAHENLGVALYNAGKLEEAVAEYRTAIQQYERPTAQVLTNYGFALLGLKQFGEAASALSSALEIEPTDYDLHYYKGFALHFSGDAAGAKTAWQKYISLAPSGQYAKEVREILSGRAQPALDGMGQ